MPPITEEADVVIVGSGPNGAAYAHLITQAAPHAKVLIVEAGPAATERPGSHLANLRDPEQRREAQIRCQGPHQYAYDVAPTSGTAHNAAAGERERALATRPGMYPVIADGAHGNGFRAAQATCNVGGMGSHWFGACPRPSDVELPSFLDSAAVASAFVVAERILGVSNTQFRRSRFASHVERVLGEVVDAGRPAHRRVQPMPMAVAVTPDGVRRWGPDAVLGPLSALDNCELRAETVCEKIIVAGDRVTGVRLRDRVTRTASVVRARYVVVAGDSFRTPQLLFASGIRPRSLGRYLNEHPSVSVLTEVDVEEPDPPHGPEAGRTTAVADPTAIAVAGSGVTWIPYDGERFPFHGMLAQIDPATVPLSRGSRIARKPLIAVHLFASQELRSENRIEFDDRRRDWLGLPAMAIHHSLSPHDRSVLEAGKREALRLSSVLGRPIEGETPWVLPSGSSLHYQGTVRMGAADNGESVCDPSCRVWGFNNLYVAGNGVISTETACNPTLTSVAFSVIGARDVAARMTAAA